MTSIISHSDVRFSLITSYEQLKTLFCEFENANKNQSLLIPSIWLNTWYNSYWQKQWLLFSFAFYHDDKLVCLAPFFIKKDSSFPYTKTLHLIGQGEPENAEVALEYLDLYIKLGYEEVVYPLVINEINKLNFDQFIVKAIFENSHIAIISPHIKGNITKQLYAQYKVDKVHWQLALLSKNIRSRINRGKNQLAKLDATLRWLTVEEYSIAWALLKSYHQNRWQNKGKTGAFASAEFSAFHKTIREQDSSMVAMSAVFVSEKPIAINYYLVTEDTYHFYQSGWDERNFAKLSPGLFLHYWSITSFPKKHYDFMMGGLTNSFKAKFNTDMRPMLSITVVKKSVKLFWGKAFNKFTRSFITFIGK